jgi:hypothetical protein
MLDKKHGVHDEYALAHIRVEVCKTKKGIMTHHYPETKEDETILENWDTGGMEQVASALLNEGVKRELYLAIFSTISQGSPLEQDSLKDKVYTAINTMVLKGIENMTPLLVKAFDQEFESGR